MSLLISNTHTSILFSFFLHIYRVGPNVIETSIARTDLNNSLKVRINKYCWITLMALFDVSNVKHSPPSPKLFQVFRFLQENLLAMWCFPVWNWTCNIVLPLCYFMSGSAAICSLILLWAGKVENSMCFCTAISDKVTLECW